MTGMRMFAAVAAVATVALSAGTGLAAGKIVISNWDGYMPPDLLERFTGGHRDRGGGGGACHQRGDHGQGRGVRRQGL